MKKSEREAQRSREFCLKYKKPDWDGCEAVEYFGRLYESDPENKYASKPKTQFFKELQDIHFGENDAYGVVVPAFVKEEVIERLKRALSEPIRINSNARNQDIYQKSFRANVERVLNDIMANKYPFQNPNRY